MKQNIRHAMIENIIRLEPSLKFEVLDQLSYTTLMYIENDLVERNKIYPKIEV